MRGVKGLIFVFFVLSTLIACKIYQNVNLTLHATIDGSCLYQTEGNETTQLFCVELPKMIYGIAYKDDSVYLAVNRGPTVIVEKRKLDGEIEATFSVDAEAGATGTLFDLAIDESGMWAANGIKLIHYNGETGIKDKEISPPTGYYSVYGVAYDQTSGNISALISDETGLDRNCPAIATYNSNLEPINFILVPGIDCLDVVFGLGYDQTSQSFWVSTSYQTPDPNLLLNISTTGELIQSVHVDQMYGSVENYAAQREMPTTGHVQITILADISQGREGRLNIIQNNPDGTGSLAQELPITIQNGQQFGFDLSVGNYWLTVNGLGFTSYAEFTVLPGQTSEVPIEMIESLAYTWYPMLDLSSPNGPTAPGNITIMEFWLAHDQPIPIKPDQFTFTLMYSRGVIVSNCFLSYLDPQSHIPIGIGVAPGSTTQNLYFGINDGSLFSESIIPANGRSEYRLSCEVTAGIDDAIRASLINFLGQPSSTPQQVEHLPLYGYFLTF